MGLKNIIYIPIDWNGRDIKNLLFYVGSDGSKDQDQSTSHWNLDRLELKNKKHDKEKMSHEGEKNQGGAALRVH